jgi:hypothetical protein
VQSPNLSQRYLHKKHIMLDSKQTIDGVEYAYGYGGNGTIRITEPIQALIDLKGMPQLSIQHEGPVTAEQGAHLETAAPAIVRDMYSKMPQR